MTGSADGATNAAKIRMTATAYARVRRRMPALSTPIFTRATTTTGRSNVNPKITTNCVAKLMYALTVQSGLMPM